MWVTVRSVKFSSTHTQRGWVNAVNTEGWSSTDLITDRFFYISLSLKTTNICGTQMWSRASAKKSAANIPVTSASLWMWNMCNKSHSGPTTNRSQESVAALVVGGFFSCVLLQWVMCWHTGWVVLLIKLTLPRLQEVVENKGQRPRAISRRELESWTLALNQSCITHMIQSHAEQNAIQYN